MIALLLGCTVPTREAVAPAGLQQGGVVTCADPSRRDEAPVDTVYLDDWPEVVAPWPHGGLAAGDIDGDGDVDLFLPHENAGALYLNDAHGLFTVATDRGFDHSGVSGWGASMADADDDGDLDLFVAANGVNDEGQPGRQAVWFNDGGGVFEEGPALVEDRAVSARGGAWADVDRDGDLDLLVVAYDTRAHEVDTGLADTGDGAAREGGERSVAAANVLLLNRGDGTFEDGRSRVLGSSPGYSYAAGWVDVEGDGWPDLYVVNDLGPEATPNELLRNEGGSGAATLRADLSHAAAVAMRGMGLASGDINGDGAPDLLVTDLGRLWLFASDGLGGHYDAAAATGLLPDTDAGQVAGWGADLADLDNDGLLDALVAFGQLTVGEREGTPKVQPDGLWLGERAACSGTRPCFGADVARRWGVNSPGYERGILAVDLDDNGFLDIVSRDIHGPTRIHLSRCGTAAWARVRLRGPAAEVVGARVEVEAGGHRQTRWVSAGSSSLGSSGPAEAHFGLGRSPTIDRLLVTWSSGRRVEWTAIESRQILTVTAE